MVLYSIKTLAIACTLEMREVKSGKYYTRRGSNEVATARTLHILITLMTRYYPLDVAVESQSLKVFKVTHDETK